MGGSVTVALVVVRRDGNAFGLEPVQGSVEGEVRDGARITGQFLRGGMNRRRGAWQRRAGCRA